MGTHHPIRKTVAPVIPDKLYFRIGDVAKLCAVPAYVLRFWETEFPQLKPNKGGTGQRLYRKRDVEMALRIKTLLYDEGYTIPGARSVLKGDVKPKPLAVAEQPSRPFALVAEPAAEAVAGTTDVAALRVIRAELTALLEMLEQPAHTTPRAKVQTMRPRGSKDNARENAPSAQLSLERDLF